MKSWDSTIGSPARFSFNSFQEIKSHSSVLYNERLAILFYFLDMQSISLNAAYDVGTMYKTRAVMYQIYKNIRSLLRNNPHCRATLDLDTKEEGVYTLDVAFNVVEQLVQYCENTGFTYRRIRTIVAEMNKIEVMLRDVLQYFHYFIRPEFKQKPDIDLASEQYKEIADQRTIDELRQIAGKNTLINFETLGTTRAVRSDGLTLSEVEEEEPEESPGAEDESDAV